MLLKKHPAPLFIVALRSNSKPLSSMIFMAALQNLYIHGATIFLLSAAMGSLCFELRRVVWSAVVVGFLNSFDFGATNATTV